MRKNLHRRLRKKNLLRREENWENSMPQKPREEEVLRRGKSTILLNNTEG